MPVFALSLVLIALVGPVMAALRPHRSRHSGWLAAFAPAAVFGRLLLQAPGVAAGNALVESHAWVPELGLELSFRLDGLSLLFALIVTGLGGRAMLTAMTLLGTQRLQGVQQRLQAASVGMSLGITQLLLSAGIHFIASAEMGLMFLLIILFAMTSPIATTAMARADYRRLPQSTQSYLTHDDMAYPAYTPDYIVREAANGAASAPAVDAHTQTAAGASEATTINF